jgi:bacteriocin-like protein
MKTLTINKLAVAMAIALWETSSLAATGKSSMANSAGQTEIQPIVATSVVPLYALSHLEAQTLAAQEMTEHELNAIEGGTYLAQGEHFNSAMLDAGSTSTTTINEPYASFLNGFYSTCGCR